MNETKGSQQTFKNTVPWIAVTIAAVTLVFSIYNNNRIKKVDYNQELIDYRMQFKQDKVINPATRALRISVDSLNKKDK